MKITRLIPAAICCLMAAHAAAQPAPNAGDEQGMEHGRLDLPQDSTALHEALEGWWKESRRTLDRRMEWYNEAKFGCFIHWGVYSDAAGEWNGRKVDGYSEHLMRKERIPLGEYRERLVYPFDPTAFDADEWMRNARDAGMRYFIVTAKHHDGFAMFHSDAYPYDLRLTRTGRDPMMELREAAGRYGIRFGFYCSHAFDWEHPDAPGNDWMYSNPGGDSLIGGANWWLTRTDFLPRAEKYVTDKSIPQIVELIEKYRPDILWFDTPHKLPLYQNIRILRAIREADPDVVVNGRLARYPGGNLGDYANTGDRAAYFFPNEGYWESIPTTNESYGYSRHDLSHKPSSHFIRLLASAASKGGNILMNVGPRDDGSWDPVDVEIFRGVGRWLDVNGESIYGTVRSGLPEQQWGVTTQREGTLYLHVFEWPRDGRLTVGGLTSDIASARIVPAPGVSPGYRRLNEHDVEIILPADAPDTVNTVIALTFSHERPPYPARLLEPGLRNVLYAFDATLHGRGLGYGDGKPSRNYVSGWTGNDQWLEWPVRLNGPASYEVSLEYNTGGPDHSGTVVVEACGHTFEVSYAPHTENRGTMTVPVGRLDFPAGETVVTLKGGHCDGGAYMRPIALRLSPPADR
ncbi:MAG: alpha-L-fucosidase [Alistipes sp.]|nr:alpha-L-fucosidase [Alistipes sp.]